MSQLIRLIGRVAFVALGLTAGFQAQAASVTIDAGGACVGFTWNGSTLSCTVDTACTVSGPSTGTPGQDVVLIASCPTSSTITWSGTGTCSPGTGNTCTANEASAVGNRTYIATGNQSVASPAKTVNWTNTQVQPGGCTLSASPSSGGPAGANVTLTAACTSGTTPITLAWTGTGTSGNCPTSMAGLSTTCTINNVSTTTTWSVNFANGAGNNNKSATYSYNAGGGGGNFAGCPSGTIQIDNAWGASVILTSDHGSFVGNELSVRFVPTAGGTSEKTSAWVEFQASAALREYSLSTSACDYSTNVLRNGLNQPIYGIGVTGPSIKYRLGTPSTFGAGLTVGTPYYINIRNRNSAGQMSCGQADCIMRGSVPK